MSQQQGALPGPPYPPQTWSLGGKLDESIDIPITSVFLLLYIGGAAGHMTIFQKNKRRGHKFILSMMMFAFCMCRLVTCILRIASATRPTNVRLAIAAQIFVAAGVLLVYVINLLFAQRLVRAQHPRLGWSKPFSIFFKANYVLIVLSLVMVITVTVQSFYTLSTNTHRIDRDVQLYTSTYFAFVSFLPMPLVLLAFALPRRTRLEKFGAGRWRTKVAVLVLAAVILCLGACYRCGTAYLAPVSRRRPLPDYYSRACFYVFNFTLEVLVIYLYIVARVDRRFAIPNGARGPGSYAPPPKDPAVTKKHDSVHSGLDRASTLGNDDRRLVLKTDFSDKQRKADLEAQQSEPHSAISGTTAALSRDHLLLPESPMPAHVHNRSENHDYADIPPVPPLPPSQHQPRQPRQQKRPRQPEPTATPATAPAPSNDDKLDKVVDLLASLDRRLSSLEDGPQRAPSALDLLDRLDSRLSRLDQTPTPSRPVSTVTAFRDNTGGNSNSNGNGNGNSNNHSHSHNSGPTLDLLDRLDRRLSRLEEHEARVARRNSGLDGLLMLDRRLSRMESRIASPSLGSPTTDQERGRYRPPPPPFDRATSPYAGMYPYYFGDTAATAAAAADRWDRWPLEEDEQEEPEREYAGPLMQHVPPPAAAAAARHRPAASNYSRNSSAASARTADTIGTAVVYDPYQQQDEPEHELDHHMGRAYTPDDGGDVDATPRLPQHQRFSRQSRLETTTKPGEDELSDLPPLPGTPSGDRS